MKRVDDRLGFDSAELVAFVTDGAPATRGRNVGSFPVLEKFVGRQITKPYCIIHVQVLSSNVLKSGCVVLLAVSIVTHLLVRGLKHRTFRASLEEVDAEYRDSISHTDARSSSLRRMGQRFVALKEEVANYF
jgi:hypothetical protein